MILSMTNANIQDNTYLWTFETRSFYYKVKTFTTESPSMIKTIVVYKDKPLTQLFLSNSNIYFECLYQFEGDSFSIQVFSDVPILDFEIELSNQSPSNL
jgi:hypothetical protein